MSYADLLFLLAPETVIVVGAFVVLGIDLLLRSRPSSLRLRLGATLTTAACLGAGIPLLVFNESGKFLDGMLVIHPLIQGLKLAMLAMLLLTAWLSVDERFTDHAGEYFALLLLATVGMMFLASTEHTLMLFVSLELLSLSLYLLTAFNKQNPQSAEAALKYFLVGGVAAACLLFGLSLLYGLTNELNLARMSAQLHAAGQDSLLILGCVLVLAGFGFKVAAAPFHLWAPDTYQGAPIPSAAFIASGSKVASFFVLAKVLLLGLAGAEGSGEWRQMSAGWMPMVAIMAAASMVIGNVAAIAQRSVRRLLAYSAVAQTGYMLLGVLADQPHGLGSLLYYIITYGLTVIGAFGVVAVVQAAQGDDSVAGFAGLGRRAPVLSACMLVFLLSLAGIPPLAGFFGKFYLFAAALGKGDRLGLLWLVILGIGMSAVSLYYYLQVLKQIYVAEAPANTGVLRVPKATMCVIAVMAVAVVVLGCLPHLLVDPILAALDTVSNAVAGSNVR